MRGTTDQQKARVAYEAICLDLAQPLREKYPGPWAEALETLNRYPKVVGVLFFEADNATGDAPARACRRRGTEEAGKESEDLVTWRTGL